MPQQSASPPQRVQPEDLPVVRPARVSDDGRFLRWLDYAKEALPVEPKVAAAAAAEPEGADAPAAEAEATAAESDQWDAIPEAIVVKRPSGGTPVPVPAGGGRGALKPIKDKLPPARPQGERPKQISKPPPREEPTTPEPPAAKRPAAKTRPKRDDTEKRTGPPIDLSKVVSFDDYNEGKTRIAPLERGSAIDGKRALKRPKFLDGKLPRSVERGVLHPEPVRIVLAAIALLLAKLLLLAVIIVFPIAAIGDTQVEIPEDRHFVRDSLPLLLVFLVTGIVFIFLANKARCRVCSCHFFYNRRCHKHKSAHRLPLVGMAGTSALHLLFFKWMRCMYCGTAIRLRGSTGVGKPVKDGELPDADEEEG